jgi:hypothetical protein
MPSRLTQAQRRLSAANARKRRSALGPALQLDDRTLDTLATVGPADVPAAEAFSRDAAGQKAVDLIRADH